MPEAWAGALLDRMDKERVTLEDMAKEMLCSKAQVSRLLNGEHRTQGAQRRLQAAFDAIAARRQKKTPANT